MSTKTKNYELVKPELTDTADITAMNGNWDKVDEELKKKYGSDNKPTASDLGVSPTGHKHTTSEITDFPTSMTPTAHTHKKSEITDFSHTHSKSEITDFPTSMTPTSHTHDVADVTGTLPISKGGTGSTSATAALTNLGAAKKTHNHTATDINSGTLSSDRLPVIPITKGGTGAADSSQARENLGISQEYWTFTLEDGTTVTKLVCAT